MSEEDVCPVGLEKKADDFWNAVDASFRRVPYDVEDARPIDPDGNGRYTATFAVTPSEIHDIIEKTTEKYPNSYFTIKLIVTDETYKIEFIYNSGGVFYSVEDISSAIVIERMQQVLRSTETNVKKTFILNGQFHITIDGKKIPFDVHENIKY